MNTAVHAVIVSFRPDYARLQQSLATLAPQVTRVVIVDNGSNRVRLEEIGSAAPAGVVAIVGEGSNVGLAAAQNQGIRHAVAAGARYVLLLDDDSIAAPDMVEQLVIAAQAAEREGRKIAGVGPIFYEESSSTLSYFVRIGSFGLRRIDCRAARTVAVDLLIASGMLIPVAALEGLGQMDESLFIDHVDTEWCLRAAARGYELLGACDARMSHRLGHNSKRVTARRRLFMHNPMRYYFIFRNSVLLYRRPYPAARWKMADAIRLLCLFGALALYVEPRGASLAAAIRGLTDGIRGRTGGAFSG